ncbi:Ig-like domain-containing protein [Oscillatoria acuminata]|uniref:Ca2+-binding protein, RTX toxin n=1 Tax=Oscillatoria acuminata PCC 6304 TaxID=56110 RepID=K9TCD9_9CYAN|nr:Ig-like domain-containing protein [Oscillatoria acuminata]AFY80093.1 Ca2+-binding protein, RTX toxin [Oscillatoria acuminata PCC 6304]
MKPLEKTQLVVNPSIGTTIPNRSIVIFDTTVEGWEGLAAGVIPGTEVVVLHPQQDGVAQIGNFLTGRSNIAALHIVSHGRSGGLYLGSVLLNADNLDSYSQTLGQWRNALSGKAEILLYGCEVAAGEIGESFVQRFSEITGADIAASDNPTGNAAKGGDWELEVRTGDINTPLAFALETIAEYAGVLTRAPEWIKQLGSSSLDDAKGITVDSAGNLYITGQTYGNLGGTFFGGTDAWIAKYNSSGTQQWVKQFGTANVEWSESITVDSAGNSYITGYTNGSLGGTHAGGYDAWVAKYDSSGTQQWVRQLGTTADDTSNSISLDSAGNLYMTGTTHGSLGGISAGNGDAWVAKYNSNGTQQWVKQFGTPGIEFSEGIAVDSAGNSYMTGSTRSDLGGTNAGAYDAWIAKYDSSGIQQWVKQLGSSSDDLSQGITVDGAGNLYITGYTHANLGGINAGGTDAWVAKYNSSGTQQWVKQLGSSSNDYSESITVDGAGNLYITGYTEGNLGGTNAGAYDAWVAKYDSSGTQQWVHQLGTPGMDSAYSIIVDNAGNPYVTGQTNGNLGGTFFGSNDAWIAKLSPIASIAPGTTPSETGPTTGTFILTLSDPAPVGGVTLNYTVAGTATSGTDYIALSGSAVIPAGSTTATINVVPIDDAVYDPNETVQITLTPGTGYKVNSSNQTATLTITDNDILDTTPPTATSFTPADNAVNVAVGANLVLQFNENVQKGTGNLVIKKVSDNSIAETIDVTSTNVTVTGNTVTINPTNDLADGIDYYVEIAAGAIKDLAENNFAGITGATAWNFKTSDTTPPTATSFTPADNAVNVAVGANLVIAFSENVQKGTGNLVIKKVSDNSIAETIDVTSTNVTVTGNTVTINPTSELADGIDYYVEIAAGAIKDLAGNNFAGITGATAWNFTTEDTTPPNPPTIANISSDSGTPGDGITNDATLIFAGTAEANSTVTLFKDGTSIGTATADASGNWTFDYTGTTLADGNYNFTATATDAASNTSSPSVAFAVTVDTTAPTVTINQDPGQPDPTAGTTVNFEVVFSETVTGLNDTDITIGGTAGATTANVTGSGTTYNVAVTGMTGPGTITASVNAGAVTDVAGNISTASTSSDNEVTYDNTSPTVTSITRADANPSNAGLVNYTVTFSEDVTGVNATDFSLAPGSIADAAITSVTGSGDTYTITINTGTGDGTVQLNLTDDDTIINSLSVPLGGVGTGNGDSTSQIYTVDKTEATVTTITSTLANGSYPVGQVIPISVTFDEVVTVTGTPELTLNSGGSATYNSGTGTNTLTFNYTVATGESATDLEATALSLAGGTITDAAGNNATLTVPTAGSASSLGGAKNFVIDTTVPTVTLASTAASIVNAPFEVSATFSETVTGFAATDISVTNGTVSSLTGSGTSYSFMVTPTGDGTVTVNVPAGGATDVSGNSNTTAAPLTRTANTSAPMATSFTPADNATTVAVGANLVVNFNEAVQKGTGNIVIKKVADNSVFETIAATDAKITVSGSTVTINPAANLAPGTDYYVEIANGAIKDSAGNNYAGIVGATSWNFKTAVPPDTTAPTATSFNPADNATSVAVGANLVVNFNEAVQKGTGNIVIKKVADNSVFETIAATDAKITVSGSTVTINPAGNLAPGTDYYVEIANGAIKDSAGNNYAGIAGATSWNFKTAIAPDTVAVGAKPLSFYSLQDLNSYLDTVYKGTSTLLPNVKAPLLSTFAAWERIENNPDTTLTATGVFEGDKIEITPTNSLSMKLGNVLEAMKGYGASFDSQISTLVNSLNFSGVSLDIPIPTLTITDLRSAPIYEFSVKIPVPEKSLVFDFIKNTLGINSLTLKVGLNTAPKGGGPYAVASLDVNKNLVDILGFEVNLLGADFYAGINEKLEGTINLTPKLQLKNYDLTQANEPPLNLSGLFTFEKESFTGGFKIEGATPNQPYLWNNPFGLFPNSTLRGGSLEFKKDLKTASIGDILISGDFNYQKMFDITLTGLAVDVKTGISKALVLTANKPVNLFEVWAMNNLSSLPGSGYITQLKPIQDAMSFLTNIIDVNIKSVDSDNDGKLDPLLKFVPESVTIGGKTIQPGFAINGEVDAWGQKATLILEANPFNSNPNAKGSLTLPAIDLGFLKIEGYEDDIDESANTLNLALNLNGSPSLGASAKVKVLGQEIAGVNLEVKGTRLNLKDLNFELPSVLSFKSNLDLDFKTLSGSGSGTINLLGQDLANATFKSNNGNLSLSGRLGVNFGDLSTGLNVNITLGKDSNQITLDYDLLGQRVNLVNLSINSFIQNFDSLSDLTSLMIDRAVYQTIQQHINKLLGQKAPPVNFNGGDGNDYKDGVDNKDILRGNGGDDTLHGRLDDDVVDGGPGNDRLMGGNGKDTIHGGDGNDVIFGQGHSDLLYGGAGDDWITGEGDSNQQDWGFDTLYGGSGNDSLYGGNSNDFLSGGDGIDFLDGGEGDDIADYSDISVGINLDLSSQRVTLPGGIIEKFVSIESADGSTGHDTLHGNSQANRLNGGAGNDQLYGYDGDDRLNGGDGNNTLLGGAGNDHLSSRVHSGKNYLNGETGNDALVGYGEDTLYGGDGNDTLSIPFSTEKFNLLYGGNDNDVLSSGDRDTLYGENGNDTLYGGQGSNYLDGGEGNDTLYGTNQYDDDGSINNYGNDTLYGGNGEDYLDGGKGNNLLNGGAGNDVLKSASNTNDTIDGGSGTDTLILEGQQKDYTFTQLNPTSWKITLTSNPAIVKIVTGIERFQYKLNLTHFDFGSRINFGRDPWTRDVIVNRSQNKTDPSQEGMSIHNETLVTQSFATFKAGSKGNGLPDNGFFPANTYHPDVQLEYRNAHDGENAKFLPSGRSFTQEYINRKYSEIHIFATSSYGADMEVKFVYTDGTSETRKVNVPDWFDEISRQSFERYYLIDGLDSSYDTTGTNYWDSSDQAIFGFGFRPNAEKTLTSFTVSNNSKSGTSLAQMVSDSKRMLTVFGATGVVVPGPQEAKQGYYYSKLGLVIDGYIADGQIFFDANLNGILDDDEPLTITQEDGRFNIEVDLEQFDTNQDGKLDHTEGQLVLRGGVDVATGLQMATPLTSTLQSTVVTPLTTIIADLVKQGTDPVTAETQVKEALGLPADVDLGSYDPLEAISNGDANGVSVFGSMIMVQNTIVQMAKFIDGVSATELAQLAYSGINAISNQTQAGTPVDLTQAETIQGILQDAITKAAQSDSTINPTQLAASAAAAAQIMALGNQIVKELVESGRPLKEIALNITKLQAVSVGQVAVGLPELAAGTVSVEEFLAKNTKEAILGRMETVEVNDPTVRPEVERDLSDSDNDNATDRDSEQQPLLPQELPSTSDSQSSDNGDNSDGETNSDRNPLILFFDADYYLAQNTDVAAAVENGSFFSVAQHFSLFGFAEGRAPSEIFAETYLTQNPDVADAVTTGGFTSGFAHFIKFGFAEGRFPSDVFQGLEMFYRSQHADAVEAVANGISVNGLEHLVTAGFAEGRDPFPAFEVLTRTFDAEYYLAQNADVAEAVQTGGFRSAMEHFVHFGMSENRQPSMAFSNNYYLMNNADVADAVSTGGFPSGYQHFMMHGMSEGRLGSSTPIANLGNFDRLFLAEAGKDILTGMDENTATNPESDSLMSDIGSDFFTLDDTSLGDNSNSTDGEGELDSEAIANFNADADWLQLKEAGLLPGLDQQQGDRTEWIDGVEEVPVLTQEENAFSFV